MVIRPALIIPTCDRPSLLPRAMSSAIAQERPFNEIIVVNDGSSPVVAPSHPGIKVVNTTGHAGLPRARMVGIGALDHSTNAVCYLDDDDELLPPHAASLARPLEEGAAFAFARATYKYPGGVETTDPEPANKGPKRYYDPLALMSQNVAPVSSFMHLRSAGDAIGWWDESLPRMEDWDFWGRMFIAGGAPAFVDEVTNVIYKDHGANMTDFNRFSYSMCCSWRDVVSDRLRHLASKGTGRLADADRAAFHVPRIGVVMPVRGERGRLALALASLLLQSLPDFEVIAVHGGPLDGAWEALQEAASRDRRVRPFRHDACPGAMVNFGLMACRSVLVAMMCSDDACEPKRLEAQSTYLDSHPDVSVLSSWSLSMDETLSAVTRRNEGSGIADVLFPTVMMRRRVAEAIGGYDEGPASLDDHSFWHRATGAFGTRCLPVHLLRYREYDGRTIGVRRKG
jgi:glycosyltransferase involved in cell wall biosynthesis